MIVEGRSQSEQWIMGRVSLRALMILIIITALVGCPIKYREDLDYSYGVQQTWQLDDLHFGELVQFESVECDPDATASLRKAITNDGIASARDVLEIDTGTGLISILCLQNDADVVVATDTSPAAVANAKYNAAILVPDSVLDVRQIEPQHRDNAFAGVGADERFDLIISATGPDDDVLVDSLLNGLTQHLNSGGRCLLVRSRLSAIRQWEAAARSRNYEYKILDDRALDSLDEHFLSGMLIELRPSLEVQSP